MCVGVICQNIFVSELPEEMVVFCISPVNKRKALGVVDYECFSQQS